MGAHGPGHRPDVEVGIGRVRGDVAHQLRHEHTPGIPPRPGTPRAIRRSAGRGTTAGAPRGRTAPARAGRGDSAGEPSAPMSTAGPPDPAFHTELPAHPQVRGKDQGRGRRWSARGTCRAARCSAGCARQDKYEVPRVPGPAGARREGDAPRRAWICWSSTWAASPRRTTSTSGSSGVGRRRAPDSPRAGPRTRQPPAICSATFEPPIPSPVTASPTWTRAVKCLAWSGPVATTSYSGTPAPVRAPSSCREVFQSRPAPRDGGPGHPLVEQAVDHAPRPAPGPVEVGPAEDRLQRIGQDQSSCPGRRWSARRDRAAGTRRRRGSRATSARVRVDR